MQNKILMKLISLKNNQYEKKYDQESFAVYKGITFYTYYTCSGYIVLLTEDEKLAKKFDFLQDDDSYYKEVSPYEVTEYYEQRFKAKYKGKRVGIMEGIRQF